MMVLYLRRESQTVNKVDSLINMIKMLLQFIPESWKRIPTGCQSCARVSLPAGIPSISNK